MRLYESAEKAKITVISGPFGAGKTNVAVNIALDLAMHGKKCRVADLDTVNPYFRSADNKQMLEELGVQTLIPEFANTNVDIPAMPLNYNLIFTGEGRSIVDVGGDADGAAVLGVSHDDYIKAGYSMYFVYNRFRPLSADPDDALELMFGIQRACGLNFCGIINNSNLGAETAKEHIELSRAAAETLAEKAGIPIIFTTSPDYLDIPGTVKIKNVTKKLF